MRARRTLAMLMAWMLILAEGFSATAGTVYAAGNSAAAQTVNTEAAPEADPAIGGEDDPAPDPDPVITEPGDEQDPEQPADPADPEEEEDPEKEAGPDDDATMPEDPADEEAYPGEEAAEDVDALSGEGDEAGELLPVVSEDDPERVGAKPYGDGDGVITSDAGNGGYQFKFAKVGYQKDDIEPQTATLTNNGTKTLTLQDPVTLTDSAKGYWEFGPFLVNGVESKSLPAGGTATFTIRPKEGIKSEMIFNADGTIDPIFEEQVNPWFSVAGTEAGSTTVHKCFFRTNLGVGLAGEYTADEVNSLYGNKGCVVVSSTTITIPKNKTLRVKGMAVDNLGGSTSAISPYTADKNIKLTIQGEGTLVSENNIDLGTNRLGSEIIINPAGSAKENDGPGNTVKVTTAGLAARVKVAIGGGEVTSIGNELRGAIKTDHYAGVIEISGGTVVAAIDCDYRPAIEASSLTVQNADLTVNASKERAIFLYASTSGTISHFQIDHARVTAISDARMVVSCSRLKLGEEAYLYAESKDTENNDTYAIQTSCDPEAPYDPYITLDDSLKIYTPESGSVVNHEGRGTIVDADGKPATKVLIQADPFKIIDKDGKPVDEQTLNWEFAKVGYTVTDNEGPEAKTVKLKNNHPAALTLEEPSVTNADLSDRWTVGPLMVDGQKTSTIPKDGTATFTIRPKPGIVATWNEAEKEWDNTSFDFTVRTADGTSEKKLTTRIMVGLIGNNYAHGNVTGSTLAEAYAEDEIALLWGSGDVTIGLDKKDHVRIGGLRMSDESNYLNLKITGGGTLETGGIRANRINIGSNDKEAANPVVYADTLEGVTGGDYHSEINIEGGEVHAANIRANKIKIGSNDEKAAEAVVYADTLEGIDVELFPSEIIIEGGEVHAAKKIVTNSLYLGEKQSTRTASAKLISDGSIKVANEVIVRNGCELTAALSDKTAAAAIECTTFTMYNATVNLTGPATSDRQYNCLQAEYAKIYDGSFTAVNSGPANGSYAVLARQIVIGSANGESYVTAVSKNSSAIVSDDSEAGSLKVNGRAVIIAEGGKGAIRINRNDKTYLNINEAVNEIALPKDGKVGIHKQVDKQTCSILDGTSIANTVLIRPKEESTDPQKVEYIVSEEPHEFTVVEGEDTLPQKVEIKNTGNVPLYMDVDFSGAGDSFFKVTKPTSYIVPGDSLIVTVNTKAGVPAQRPEEPPYTGELRICPYTIDHHYIEGWKITSIPFFLTVTPAFTLSPSGTVSLGEIMQGERFEPPRFILTNTGTRTRDYDIEVEGVSGLFTNNRRKTLKPGQSSSIDLISWAMDDPGDVNAQVVVYSGDRSSGKDPKTDSTSIIKRSYLSGKVCPVPDGLWMKQVPDQVYDGTAKKPAPEVWYGTTKLSEQDYTVTYTNNVNVAEADATKTVGGKDVSIAPTVTVKGKGNYTGTRSVRFAIKAAPIGAAYTDADQAFDEGKLNAHVTLAANGQKQQPKIVLKYKFADGRVVTLKEKTEYILSCNREIRDPGTYDVTVNGLGNYTGTRTLKFAVVDPDSVTLISKATIPAVPNQTVDIDGKKIVLKTKAAAACGNDEVFALDASKKNDFLFTVKKGTEILKEGKDYALSYSDNQKAGTATVTVSGKGRWAGSVTKTFQIAAVPLSGVKQEGFAAELFYTGGVRRQPMKLVDNTLKKELRQDKDYEVVCSPYNPQEPGTYEVTYTGKGRYTGTVKKTYRITNDIKVCTVEGLDPTCLWTGSEIVLADVKLSGGGRELIADTDYERSITNNTNPGTATVTFTGKGKYTGTLKKTFRIVTCPIDADARLVIKQPGDPAGWNHLENWGAPDKEQSASWATATYRKSGAKPEPVIVDKGRNNYILAAGTDYTLQWSNNTAVYTAADLTTNKKVPTLTITGKGRYAGKMTRSFFMGQASFADVTVTASDVTYKNSEGAYRATTVKLTDSEGKTLTAGTDYWLLTDQDENHVKFEQIVNNATQPVDPKAILDAGSQIVLTLYGKGNYTGPAYAMYYVTAGSIASASIKAKDKTYNGSAVTLSATDFPDVEATIGSTKRTLKYGQDYKIVPGTYQNNDRAGTARVTVRASGNAGLTGTKVVSFTIKKYTVDDGFSVTVNGNDWTEPMTDYPSFPFTKNGVKPEPTVLMNNGHLLTAGTDYTLAWSNNTKPLTATGQTTDPTLKITLKGNYSGTLTRRFSISKPSLNTGDFTLSVSNKLQPMTHTGANNAEVLDGLIFKEAAMTATLTENASGKKLGGNEFTVSYAYDADGTVKRRDEGMSYIGHPVAAGNPVLDGDVLEPGTMLRAIVAAAGTGNYQNNYTDTFRVFATENLGAATITAPADLEYCATTTGQITAGTDRFVVKARVGTSTVVLDPSCYQLDNWQDNDKAGTAKVTVSGIEEKGVKGSKTVAVRIAPALLEAQAAQYLLKVRITDDDKAQKEYYTSGIWIPAYYYTKSGVKPVPDEVILTDSPYNDSARVRFEKDRDYTVSWKANTKAFTVTDRNSITAQTPVMVLTGKGNLTGKLEIPFTIRKTSVNDEEFAVSAADVVYQYKPGNFLQRDVTLTDADGKKLVSGTDYYAAADNAYPFIYRNGGTSAITVKKGNTSRQVDPNDEVFKDETVLYEPGQEVLISVEVTGKNNYYDANKNCTYRMIAAANLNTATATIPEQVYTGKEIKLTGADDIKVKMQIPDRTGQKVTYDLVKDRDYTITGYENNTKAGTAKVTITGVPEKGFAGSKTFTFKITAYDLGK